MALQLYTEPLEPDELQYLITKEQKERKMYYRIFRILMIVSFVLPYIAAWFRVTDVGPLAFSRVRFFVSAGILLFISVFSTYTTYRLHLRKVQMDIKRCTKTIEVTQVTSKVHVPQTSAWYFYISSAYKLSIEVSEKDYASFRAGDEVCLEYTTYAKEYLGYF